jgi:hypothetical protein
MLFKKTDAPDNNNKERGKTISIVMAKDIIQSIDAARGNHFSRSAFLRMAVLEKMQRDKKENAVLQGLGATNYSSQATSVIHGDGAPRNDNTNWSH